MAQLVAAQQSIAVGQQGLTLANNTYDSRIVQDALSGGSITHKLIYGIILGGTGYVVASFATGNGNLLKSAVNTVIEAVPIVGSFISRVDKKVSGRDKQTPLQKYGGAR